MLQILPFFSICCAVFAFFMSCGHTACLNLSLGQCLRGASNKRFTVGARQYKNWYRDGNKCATAIMSVLSQCREVIRVDIKLFVSVKAFILTGRELDLKPLIMAVNIGANHACLPSKLPSSNNRQSLVLCFDDANGERWSKMYICIEIACNSNHFHSHQSNHWRHSANALLA